MAVVCDSTRLGPCARSASLTPPVSHSIAAPFSSNTQLSPAFAPLFHGMGCAAAIVLACIDAAGGDVAGGVISPRCDAI